MHPMNSFHGYTPSGKYFRIELPAAMDRNDNQFIGRIISGMAVVTDPQKIIFYGSEGNRIQAIKAVKKIADLGLKEAKDLVDLADSYRQVQVALDISNLSQNQVQEAINELKDIGAKFELR